MPADALHFLPYDITLIFAACNLCASVFEGAPPERADLQAWFKPHQSGTAAVAMTPRHVHRVCEDLCYLHGFAEAGFIQMGHADGTHMTKEEMLGPIRALLLKAIRASHSPEIEHNIEARLAQAAQIARDIYADVIEQHAGDTGPDVRA